MDQSGYNKHHKKTEQLGSFSFGKPNNILVHIMKQPFVDHNIPFSIVIREIRHIPPVYIELPVPEHQNFSPQIKPAVKQSEKHKNQKHSRRDHRFEPRDQHKSDVDFFFPRHFKIRYARALEYYKSIKNCSYAVRYVRYYHRVPAF